MTFPILIGLHLTALAMPQTYPSGSAVSRQRRPCPPLPLRPPSPARPSTQTPPASSVPASPASPAALFCGATPPAPPLPRCHRALRPPSTATALPYAYRFVPRQPPAHGAEGSAADLRGLPQQPSISNRTDPSMIRVDDEPGRRQSPWRARATAVAARFRWSVAGRLLRDQSTLPGIPFIASRHDRPILIFTAKVRASGKRSVTVRVPVQTADESGGGSGLSRSARVYCRP